MNTKLTPQQDIAEVIRELLNYARGERYIELNLRTVEYPDLALKLAELIKKEAC